MHIPQLGICDVTRRRAERPADLVSMAVVRNPYDRLHSIYEFYIWPHSGGHERPSL